MQMLLLGTNAEEGMWPATAYATSGARPITNKRSILGSILEILPTQTTEGIFGELICQDHGHVNPFRVVPDEVFQESHHFHLLP